MEQVIPVTGLFSENDRGIIEVLDRSGKVVQRADVDQNSLTIGRSYSNDIILDDQYVCPEHVSVNVVEGMLFVNDLNSVNGLSQNKYHFRGEQLKLASNDTFKMGHTTIRYRSASTQLQPTKIDRHLRRSFWSLHNPVLVFLASIILIGFIVFEAIFTQSEETENIKVLAASVPAIITILSWAGVWALFGKLMIDRFSFVTHMGIFSVANIGFYLCSIVLGYICYAFGFDHLYSTIFAIFVSLIAIWMLYTHLGYSTRMSFRSMLTTSVVMTVIGASFYILQSQVMESEFNYMPGYDVILKSPDYNFVEGESLEDFFADTEKLKDRVNEEVEG